MKGRPSVNSNNPSTIPTTVVVILVALRKPLAANRVVFQSVMVLVLIVVIRNPQNADGSGHGVNYRGRSAVR